MDRTLWNAPFTRTSAPPWPCPTCGAGTLRLLPKTLHVGETVTSRRGTGDHPPQPEEYAGHFHVRLRCDEEACLETVFVAGDVAVEVDYDETTCGARYQEVLRPRHVAPPPALVVLPPNTPHQVAHQVRRACGLVWQDPAAAGNRVRVAAERLLDALGVEADGLSKKGEPWRLSLHQRILRWRETEPALGDQLLAVKWLGNAGSHDDLEPDAVFDALEILAFVLEDRYVGRAQRVAALAGKINARYR